MRWAQRGHHPARHDTLRLEPSHCSTLGSYGLGTRTWGPRDARLGMGSMHGLLGAKERANQGRMAGRASMCHGGEGASIGVGTSVRV